MALDLLITDSTQYASSILAWVYRVFVSESDLIEGLLGKPNVQSSEFSSHALHDSEPDVLQNEFMQETVLDKISESIVKVCGNRLDRCIQTSNDFLLQFKILALLEFYINKLTMESNLLTFASHLVQTFYKNQTKAEALFYQYARTVVNSLGKQIHVSVQLKPPEIVINIFASISDIYKEFQTTLAFLDNQEKQQRIDKINSEILFNVILKIQEVSRSLNKVSEQAIFYINCMYVA